ncbi:MAG: DUF898 family protein, partial [Pseudomonadota bacterium]
TFGIYRFWAKTRVRQYLWGHTRFYNEHMEYSGTGKELFVSFLIVFFLVLLPLYIAYFYVNTLIQGGNYVGGGVAYFILVLFTFYLFGVAVYRAFHYKLTRTIWRGIRGGMRHRGWSYALEYWWRSLLVLLTFGLYSPISTTRLWDRQMREASFGSFGFEASTRAKPLWVPVIAAILSVAIFSGAVFGIFSTITSSQETGGQPPLALVFLLLGLYFAAFLIFPFLSIWFNAVFYRQAFQNLRYGNVGFTFDATLGDWFKYYLVNVLIVAFTFGLGAMVLPFRLWNFMISHLHVEGTLDTTELMQSSQQLPSHGEGLADALDIGGI